MKRLLVCLAILVAVLIAAAVALVFLIDVNRFRPALESSLTTALQRDVTLGNLRLSLFTGSIEAEDLEVAEDAAFGKGPFLRAKAIRMGVLLKSLIFERKVNVTAITIERPEISLLQSPAGGWNYSSLGSSAAPPARTAGSDAAMASAAGLALTVNQLNIANGSLTLSRTGGKWKPLVLENVNLEVKNFSPLRSFPFILTTEVKGGGSIKLDGTAGPINTADASMTAAVVNFKMEAVDLAATGLANYAPDMSGIIALSGSGQTDGTSMQLKGTIKAEKLKLSKIGTPAAIPVQLGFDISHNMRKHSGQVRHGDLHIGKASANLTGTYSEQGQDMILKMNFAAAGMPVSEIAAMLGPLGIVLPSGSSLRDGTINAQFAINGAADRLVIDGSFSVRDTTLAGFDLGKNLAVIQQLAGIQTGSSTQIKNASSTLHISPEGIRTKDLQLNVPSVGDLRGDGSISPANDLNFKMTVALHTTGMASFIADKPIPFFVLGNSANPQFKPDIKSITAEQVNSFKKNVGAAIKNRLKDLFGGKKKEGQ